MVFTSCSSALAFSWTDAAKWAKEGVSGIFSPKTLVIAGVAVCAGSIWGGIKAYSAEDGKGFDAFLEGFGQGFKVVF